MSNKYSCATGLTLLVSMLTACGPGGDNSGDVFPRETQPASIVTGPNSFLLFPNPQKQDDGTLQTNTTAYATAYYEAIDPNNDKDTLEKWKTANGFGNSSTGTETTVVFGDVKDLGYGRRMTARKNNDGTIAVMVENYLVGAVASYTYSSFNVEAAVVQDQRWHVGTNGIEYSSSVCMTGSDVAACSPTTRFAKFFTFDPKTGNRLLEAQLDGLGNKAMPGICINCHGGRADPLTPAAGSASGKQLFPLLGNTASQKRGDVMANLQPLKVDSFDFSSRAGYTRAEQEAKLKIINKMVLSSYPIAAAPACLVTPPLCPEDVSRRLAVYGEWGGTAAALIKSAYGGDGLPDATFSDTYVPLGWSVFGQTALYNNVVASSCRTCHILRGTNAMDEINFDNYCVDTFPSTGTCNPASPGYYFQGYADRIKAHVIDRGNMPLAKIVYERLWGSSEADTLATFLQSAQSQAVRDVNGAVLKPGRPVAVPGPDRTTTSPATLSAAGSLYASSYSWSVVSGGGTLTNPASATPTLTAANLSTNVLRLRVGNGATQSDPVEVTVKIDNTLSPAPSAIRFADIKAVLKSNSAGCTGCHYVGGGPPIFYSNISNLDFDRNGDSFVDATDDKWFYTELRGRINFTDIAASPLLSKPSGKHHGGGLVFNTANVTACAVAPAYPDCAPYATLGAYYAAKYNMFVNWILNGAPY
jgi:hypothetical protein